MTFLLYFLYGEVFKLLCDTVAINQVTIKRYVQHQNMMERKYEQNMMLSE